MMKKRFINTVIFSCYCLYAFFLFFRVFSERNPSDPLIMTGIIFLIFSFRKFILFSYSFYKSYFHKEGPSRRFVKIYLLFDKVIHYLDVEFLQKGLNNNLILNWLFFEILISLRKFVQDYPNHIIFYQRIIFLIPWSIGLISFFLELLLGTNLFFTLYCFSIYFLVKKIFYCFLYISQMKYNHLNVILFNNYLSVFSKHGVAKAFFLINCMVMEKFFATKEFQNKRMLRYFWNLFNEINTYRLAECRLHVTRLAIYKPLENLLKIINITVFGFSFILLLINRYFSANDLFFAFWLFSLVFVIFLVWLNSLYDQESQELLDQEKRLVTHLSGWFCEAKHFLLNKHSFLTNYDLSYEIDDRDAFELSADEMSNFQNDFLTGKEKENLILAQENFTNWLDEEILNERVDLVTYKYTP